ncbi:MAG: hypothetical protein K2Q03_02605 [Sphingobacteriaceae bacterium]|nr:hypothetical protein [Sphingobacteriaceae bacterium]
MNFIRKIGFLFFCLCCTYTVKAQEWKLSVLTGASGYIGDLNPINPVKLSGYYLGLNAKYSFNSVFNVGLHYSNGNIAADDAASSTKQFRDRNLSFSTNLNELSTIFDFNFFSKNDLSVTRKFYPYVFLGFGAVHFSPKTTYRGETVYLRDYATENVNYSKYAFVIPYGVGFNYDISEEFSLFTQLGYREVFTDYLDDVSGVYQSKEALKSDPIRMALADRSVEVGSKNIGLPGVQRGDFRKRDTYMFVGIGISFTFVSQGCNTIRKN